MWARALLWLTAVCIALGCSGCATATITTLGTVAGAIGPSISAGREVFTMGKLETAEPGEFYVVLAATHKSAQELGLRYCPLPRDLQGKDPTRVDLRFFDDRCQPFIIRLERRAAMLVRVRIDVGIFGSEPTARLFLAVLRTHIPPFPPGSTRPVQEPQIEINLSGA
jgi:hypothetical protein